jgi:hypothetical protein
MNKNSKVKTINGTNKSRNNNKTLKNKPIKQFNVSDILKDTKGPIIPVFETFEDKYEEELKKQNIDILVRNHNLEKKTLRDIHEALNMSKYNPVNDFYSYRCLYDDWLSVLFLEVLLASSAFCNKTSPASFTAKFN